MFHSRSETRLRRNAGRSSELARWGQLPNMVGFGLLAPGLLRLVKVQRSKCHPPALVHWHGKKIHKAVGFLIPQKLTKLADTAQNFAIIH